MSEQRTGTVIRDHEAAYPEPLIVKTGEVLTITTRQSEWPGWRWCVNTAGRGGWVPQAWIERDGKGNGDGDGKGDGKGDGDVGRMLRDYDATELTARVGERLTIELAESGWLWCINEPGEHGWIPQQCVQTD